MRHAYCALSMAIAIAAVVHAWWVGVLFDFWAAYTLFWVQLVSCSIIWRQK